MNSCSNSRDNGKKSKKKLKFYKLKLMKLKKLIQMIDLKIVKVFWDMRKNHMVMVSKDIIMIMKTSWEILKCLSIIQLISIGMVNNQSLLSIMKIFQLDGKVS